MTLFNVLTRFLHKLVPARIPVSGTIKCEVYGELDKVIAVLKEKLVEEKARIVFDGGNTIRAVHGELKAYRPSYYKKYVTITARKEGLRTILNIHVDVKKYVFTWLTIDAVVLALGAYIAYSALAATLYMFNIVENMPLTPLSKYIIDVVGTSFLLDMMLVMSGLMILFTLLDIYPTLNALKFSHNWVWELVDRVKSIVEQEKK